MRGLGWLLGLALATTAGGIALAVAPRRSTAALRSSDDDDGDGDELPDLVSIKSVDKRKLAARAQKVYDAWDADSDPDYGDPEVGFGGICHLIADEVTDELYKQGAAATPTACSYEQHVFVTGQFKEGVYRIDIPAQVYERGAGYRWTKIPDVTFEPEDIVLDQVSHDPRDFAEYTEER
jgi:hypothetical protein